MIEWIEYDKNSREIESHVDHLVTNGIIVVAAQHVHLGSGYGYGWKCHSIVLEWVTHWAKINLPVGGTGDE